MNQPNMNKTYRSFFLLLFCVLMFTAINGCNNGADIAVTPTPTPILTTGSLTLGISSSIVTFGTPVTVGAILRNAYGVGVPGAVVTFAASSALVTFTPVSATALTNVSGVATITLNAASFDSAGATSITASAPLDTTTVTSTPVGIAVNGATLTLGAITLGLSPISSYGTSSVSVPVFLGGSPATVPISVAFTSTCVASGKATITSPVTTIAGTATSTYKDNNCAAGTDLITASVTGASVSATITVTLPAINNIQFISATPVIIGTSTASSALLPTSSVVKFKVVDSSNNGKPGVIVDFTVVPASKPGGLDISAISATSDVNGEVTTSLSSGTIPTPVWVVATVREKSLKSQSNTLTITTGMPTQNFFSFSLQIPNIEGWDYDNETSSFTVIASDRLGNPVPNGTEINFIAEGGHIDSTIYSEGGYAVCQTKGGVCSVTFRSAEYRPINGRVSILAYAAGEKSFLDGDSGTKNSYDSGETFYDLGDPYLDNDESGSWDPGEFSVPSTTSGDTACMTQPGAGALPASYSNALSKTNTCTAEWGQNYVRRNAVMVLSGSYAQIPSTTVTMAGSCVGTVSVSLKDINNNPMPSGTTVGIENNYVYYTWNGSELPTLAGVLITNGTPVLNTTNVGGTLIGLRVDGGPNCMAGVIDYPAGTVDIVVTTPNGNKTTIPVIVN